MREQLIGRRWEEIAEKLATSSDGLDIDRDLADRIGIALQEAFDEGIKQGRVEAEELGE